MLRQLLLLSTIVLFTAATGQTKRAVELSALTRYDQHADYVSNFAGRVYNDTNRLYGMNYGLNILGRQQLPKRYSLYLGIGYYRLGIDKIRGPLPFNIPGIRTGRNINYDDGITNLGYGTTKYYYNNLAFTLGLSKAIPLKNSFALDIGVEGIGYYTLSQRYELSRQRHYSTKNTKPIEFGANVLIGVTKEYKTLYLKPALLIPIYQNLKGDRVFYEDRNQNIPKWFRGIGFSLKLGKYL